MSMPVLKPIVTTGLVITPEMAAHIIIADRKAAHMLDPEIKRFETNGTLEEKIANHEISNAYYILGSAATSLGKLTGKPDKIRLWDYFTGTASTLTVPNAAAIPIHMTFCNEKILYIQTKQRPNLFKAGYQQPKELIVEMQEYLNCVFPNNTNFIPYLCAIEGIAGKIPNEIVW